MNHERSKKHLKEVERLKREMWEEEHEMMGEVQDEARGVDEDVSENESTGSNQSPPKSPNPIPEDQTDETAIDEDEPSMRNEVSALPPPAEEETPPNMKSKKSKRRKPGTNTSTPRDRSPERLTKTELKVSLLQERDGFSTPSSVQNEVEGLDGDAPSEGGTSQPRPSKKDIRRAKEAAKKAKQEEAKSTEEVREDRLRPLG
jgi:DnaJ family protein A protein 5